MKSKIEIFWDDIERYWNADGRNSNVAACLLNALRAPEHQITEDEFIEILTETIENEKFSLSDYERRVWADFASRDDAVEDLMALQDLLRTSKQG